MTEWINVGVRIDGERVRTKSALVRAVREHGAPVFDVTDAVGHLAGRFLNLGDLNPGQAFQVTGPDPYTDRRWYATVKKRANGVGYTVS